MGFLKPLNLEGLVLFICVCLFLSFNSYLIYCLNTKKKKNVLTEEVEIDISGIWVTKENISLLWQQQSICMFSHVTGSLGIDILGRV